MRPRVLLDVDGVIADMVAEMLRALKTLYGIDKTPEDVTKYEIEEALNLDESQQKHLWMVVGRKGGAAELPTYPGAVEGVKALMGVADVFFVTSPVKTAPTWTYDRTEWLKKLFGEKQARMVVYTSEKYTVHGHVFVDDRGKNVEEWAKEWPEGVPVLWDQPWNQEEDLPRLNKWEQVLKIVRTLAGKK